MDISDRLHIEVLMARAVLQFFSSFLLPKLPYVPGLIPKENSSAGIQYRTNKSSRFAFVLRV